MKQLAEVNRAVLLPVLQNRNFLREKPAKDLPDAENGLTGKTANYENGAESCQQ
jgi:hypothetical protein